MGTHPWLTLIYLVLIGIWIVELVMVYRRAPLLGRDPLTLLSGAVIFFVLALPMVTIAPGIVEKVGEFWGNVVRLMTRRPAEALQTTPRLVMPGRTVLLAQDRIRIGRYPNNDIVIDHPTVSAYHAELVRRPDGRYELIDRESRNGTRINGTPVRNAILRHGDQITFGAITVHYLAMSTTEQALNRGGMPIRH